MRVISRVTSTAGVLCALVGALAPACAEGHTGGWQPVHSDPPPFPSVARLAQPRATVSLGSIPYMADSACTGDQGLATDDTADAVSNLPDVKFVYAYASDSTNRYPQLASEFQQNAKGMAQIVAGAPGSAKAIRFDMGTPCGPQYIDVQVVRLSETSAQLRAQDSNTKLFNLVTAHELADAGVDVKPDHPRDWVVYVDDSYNGDSVGTSFYPGDAQPGAANFSNAGGRFALVWGFGDPGPGDSWTTFQNFLPGQEYERVHAPLHELFHALGAVVNDAKFTSGHGHCTDEWDLMCYSDYPGVTTTTACTGDGDGSQITYRDNILDCNQDTYFQPSGGLLGASGQPVWNTYDSVFLCSLDHCANAPPSVAISASPKSTAVGRPVELSAAGSSDDHGISGYRWDLDGNGSFESDTGSMPTASATFGSPGGRTVAVQVTDSDGIARTAHTAIEVSSAAGPSAPGASLLTVLRLSPKRFRAARAGGGFSGFSGFRAAGKTGTSVSFALTRAARVSFRAERASSGRRAGTRCVKPTRANRRAKPCKRYLPVSGSSGLAGRAGANRGHFSGRLGARKLAPGTYRLVATPAGGASRRAPFTIRR
jgi:hypothetical protein